MEKSAWVINIDNSNVSGISISCILYPDGISQSAASLHRVRRIFLGNNKMWTPLLHIKGFIVIGNMLETVRCPDIQYMNTFT